MKMFNKSALALALAASAGMANAAGVIDVQATFAGGALTPNDDVVGDATGAVGLSSLLAENANTVDLDGAIARSVVYSPNTAISTNSTLVFETTNGAVVPPAGALSLCSPDAVGSVANLVDFSADADGNYTRMRFQITQDLVAGNGYILADTNGAGPFTCDDASFVANAGLTEGDSVSIAATSAQDPTAIAIEQGTAPAENVITVQGALTVTPLFVTSVIDVEADPSRTAFVDEGVLVPGDAGTTETVSQAGFDIADNTEISPDLSQAGYTLTLTRANIDGVDDGNVDLNIAGVGAVDVPLVGSDFVLQRNDASELLADNHSLEITVNGTDVLQTGAWSLTVSIDDAADDTFSAFTPVNAAASHTFDINGAQVKIPYHAQNASGFVFFIKAVNESSNDAAILADVIVENVSQGNRTPLTNVNIGTATASGSSTVGQQAIKDAINAATPGTINDSDVYHVAMTLTVIAPQNSVQIAAFQKDAIGRTSVPVFVNTGNNNDSRVWQQ